MALKILLISAAAIISFIFPVSINSQLVNYTSEYGSDSGIGVLGPLSQGSYVAVPFPNDIYYQLLQSGNISAWVLLTSYSQNSAYIIYKNPNFNLAIGGDTMNHKPYLQIGSLRCMGSSQIPLNKWTHIAAEWNRDEGLYRGSIYVNGLISGYNVITSGFPLSPDSINIGGNSLDPGSSLIGFLDEVRLSKYNFNGEQRFTALGEDPLANLNNAITSSNSYEPVTASWSFNDGVSTVASDRVGIYHGYYRRGGKCTYINNFSKSVPYNLALKVDAISVRIDHNDVFNRNSAGTIDCWLYRDSFMVANSIIITKGNSEASTTFRLYTEPAGSLGFQIGSGHAVSDYLPLKKWTHIAVTWKNGSEGYTVKFYINGRYRNQAVINSVMPLNADTVWIGGSSSRSGEGYTGYLDELRIWKSDLTAEQIKNNMFVSSETRSDFQIQNVGIAWNFEGNLLSIGQGGIFTNFTPEGTVSRFSAYSNEQNTGSASDMFIAHPTAINRNLGGGVFPGEFTLNTPDKSIPAGETVSDTISINNNSSLLNIEIFLSYQHASIGENTISLKAPNGQTRFLLNGEGGEGNDILTFFSDGGEALDNFYPPWSPGCRPNELFGNFGNTNAQGNWIINIHNSDASNTGKLLGWGLRFNSTTIGIEQLTGIAPGKFKLFQNYPNPFNPSTNIRFDIPKDSEVKIAVFDVVGREVQVLANSFMQAGSYEVNFDSSSLSSGVYFYTIEAGDFKSIKKMILIK